MRGWPIAVAAGAVAGGLYGLSRVPADRGMAQSLGFVVGSAAMAALLVYLIARVAGWTKR
jgi:hypothetical protein